MGASLQSYVEKTKLSNLYKNTYTFILRLTVLNITLDLSSQNNCNE